MFNQLSALNTSHTAWKVKVRLTRMWPSVSNTSDSRDPLRGYNLILLDDDNCHVQAFVYADIWKGIKKDMAEGGVYIISNFYTKEPTSTLRPTSSKILINFSNSTIVQKVEEDDFMIPKHKFEFYDLSELFRIASSYENPENPDFATDVIGVLEDFEDVRPIKTVYGEKSIVKFRITDGRYSHKVTVWGQLAEKTDDLYHKIEDRPIIVIVSGCKMKIFKNSVQINSIPSTKIYLNLDDAVVTAMRIRLEEEGYKAPEDNTQSPIPDHVVNVIETITLKELCDKTTTDDIKRKFLCFVKIATVEKGENWWYLSCTDCQNEVFKLEGRYKCLKCIKAIPVAEKRYKIVVLAGDSTEAFTFVLSDRAARRLLGQYATTMIADNTHLEQAGEYPTKIEELVGKECTFKIEISEDNVLVQSKIYNVIDAYESDTSTLSPPSGSTPGFTISSFAENMIDLSNCGETPGSLKSCAKKPKVEK